MAVHTEMPCLAPSARGAFLRIVFIAAPFAGEGRAGGEAARGFCHVQLMYDRKGDFHLLFRDDQGTWPLLTV